MAALRTTVVEQRDARLLSCDFFDAEAYPRITFSSTKVEPKGGERFRDVRGAHDSNSRTKDRCPHAITPRFAQLASSHRALGALGVRDYRPDRPRDGLR